MDLLREELPVFLSFYPGLTPAAFYDLDDDDRNAMREYLLRVNREMAAKVGR